MGGWRYGSDRPGCSGAGEVGLVFWRLGVQAFGTAGMVKVPVVPIPSSLSMEIEPLRSSAIDRAMVSPSPAPGIGRTNSF